jgi:hypothetical protein
MQGEMIQQIVQYLRDNPDAAKRARDYVKTHPDDVKAAFREVAEKRGWDLSKIDTTQLKNEVTRIAA